LNSREVHWPLMIMVVIAIGICWMLYIICYGAGVPVLDVLQKWISGKSCLKNFFPVVLSMIRGGSCKFGALVKVASSAARVIMVDL